MKRAALGRRRKSPKHKEASMREGTPVLEDFADKIGHVFAVTEADFPAIPLTLTEAEPLPNRPGPGMRPPFSLVFLAKDPRILPQRLYRLAHEEMGELTIFLVPIGKDAEGVSYQAVFN
jgi:Domain of unknown function (DUF6916)